MGWGFCRTIQDAISFAVGPSIFKMARLVMYVGFRCAAHGAGSSLTFAPKSGVDWRESCGPEHGFQAGHVTIDARTDSVMQSTPLARK